MKLIRRATEDEMILEFLKQEAASIQRYGESIAASLAATSLQMSIITLGNLANDSENADRRKLFAEYRGYGRPGNSYFTDFPVGRVEWAWMRVNPDELLTTLFVRYWAERWGSTRLPRELAERIRKRLVSKEAIEGDWITPHVERAREIREGLIVPPLILVSADGGETRVAMEGKPRDRTMG